MIPPEPLWQCRMVSTSLSTHCRERIVVVYYYCSQYGLNEHSKVVDCNATPRAGSGTALVSPVLLNDLWHFMMQTWEHLGFVHSAGWESMDTPSTLQHFLDTGEWTMPGAEKEKENNTDDFMSLNLPLQMAAV